jgi:hypothetical protein
MGASLAQPPQARDCQVVHGDPLGVSAFNQRLDGWATSLARVSDDRPRDNQIGGSVVKCVQACLISNKAEAMFPFVHV